MTIFDPRLTTAGITIGTATLAAIFADHYRGIPAKSVCPGCGYQFSDRNTQGDCPTNAIVRPLLQVRGRENPRALRRLTPDQREDLKRNAPRPAHRRAPAPCPPQGELFDTVLFRRTGGSR